MKKLIPILFSLLIILLIFSACDENPSSIKVGDNSYSIIGTWKEIHLRRYDSLNTIIEDINLDTVRISKLSLFNEKLHKLHIDTLKHNLYFLLYEHYIFKKDSIHYFPDSLLDVESIIHHWDPQDSSFNPDFPVKTRPFVAYIRFIDNNNILETRNFPTQKLEISWKRLSINPIDLKPELISINPKILKKIRKDYFEINRKYSPIN